MSQIMSHIEYLSKGIGPRPAGTEEEQQAALYITEQFQKEAGFTAAMEDFSSASNVEAGLAVLAAVSVVATILAVIFPVLSIPAFILAVVSAVIYALEAFDRPVLSRALSRGASQNVVAKYHPGGVGQAAQGRRGGSRKIILIAHYDTGRVTPPLVQRVESSGLPLALICVAAMIAVAFFLLIRIFIASSGGMGLLVLNVLSILAAVICLMPIIKAVLVRSAPYNEGATNNATGTAALVEIARRIARGSMSEADLASAAEGVTVHGEAAAREAGLVPEGAQIQYEAEQLEPPAEIGDYSDEERLLSAKAAIAALTGRPVERRVFGSVADNLVNSHAEENPEGVDALDEVMAPIADSADYVGAVGVSVTGAPAHDFSSVPGVSTAPGVDAPAAEPAAEAEGFENAPSWFVAAQQNARKAERYNADEEPQIKRSRYTEAIENAERGRADREEEARAAEWAAREEERLAREAEARASLDAHANAQAEPAAQVEPAAQPEPVAQSPYGTVAMSAPIPASEILAEAAAADAAAQAEPAQVAFARSLPTIEPAPEPEPEAPAHDRIAAIPSIDPANPYIAETSNPSRSGILRKLRTNIPSLSGLIAPVPAPVETQPEPVANPAQTAPTAGVAPAAQTAPQPEPQPGFEPIPSFDEPAAYEPAPYEAPAYEASAYESYDAYEAPAQETGAFDPEPIERSFEPAKVPHSRSGGLLSRLRKNDEPDEELSDTPQQWLNIDDDFDARSVGRARGSWESFRDDQYDDDEYDPGDFGSGDFPAPRGWEGGAFSRTQLGHVDMRSGEAAYADEPLPDLPPEAMMDPSITGDIEQIYHFRNPQFNTEIWFVAMGADGMSHDGARAFMAEHRDELRGSTIIEIESLGSGVLSVASEEGRVRKVTASSRVKRALRGATAATGISPDSVSLVGTDSISSTLQKAGYQAMHLFGAEDGRPALKGSADDVLENINAHALDEHISFIFELLKD